MKNLKLEYSIVSRGTEKYGSKGYMGVSQIFDGKRYFVLANHFEKNINNYKDAFLIDKKYSIENIVLSRFQLITKLAFENKMSFVNENIIIIGCGSLGMASLIFILSLDFKEITVLVKNIDENLIKTIENLNKSFESNITLTTTIDAQYNTYIETVGDSQIINQVIINIDKEASIFLLGTPRDNICDINPLDIHRKNICLFGGHELKGHTWEKRNKFFLELLEKNEKYDIHKLIKVHNEECGSKIINEILIKKNNFFEVIKYDI